MTGSSISDYVAFLNIQIDQQEALSQSLVQIEALLYMSLRDDFLEASEDIMQNYLWTISDMVEKVRAESDHLLSEMLQYYRRAKRKEK